MNIEILSLGKFGLRHFNEAITLLFVIEL